MGNSICLVACYFGEWPKYMNIFLETCRHNPSVDFLLFSDCGPRQDAPSNVRIVPTTMEAVRDRAKDRLGIDPALPVPYSLCDFKPTYGVLFNDYLESYDFWGCTDLDLIYGNIRSFITDDLLAENDIISARAPYLTGFFWLFRNVGRVNRLYTRSADYKRVLESEKHFSFAECNHRWEALIDGASIFDLNIEIESMTEVIQREEREGRVRTHFADLGRENINDTTFTWEDGQLIEISENKRTERLLLHFVHLKDGYLFSFPEWEGLPSRFHVYKTGLYRDCERDGIHYLRALPVVSILSNWLSENVSHVVNKVG